MFTGKKQAKTFQQRQLVILQQHPINIIAWRFGIQPLKMWRSGLCSQSTATSNLAEDMCVATKLTESNSEHPRLSDHIFHRGVEGRLSFCCNVTIRLFQSIKVILISCALSWQNIDVCLGWITLGKQGLSISIWSISIDCLSVHISVNGLVFHFKTKWNDHYTTVVHPVKYTKVLYLYETERAWDWKEWACLPLEPNSSSVEVTSN